MCQTCQPSWLADAYGSEAAQLLKVITGNVKCIEELIEASVEKFYQNLKKNEAAMKILSLISIEAFQHLKEKQIDHLKFILNPTLSSADHYAKSIKIGQRHFNVGLPIQLLVESMVLYIDVTKKLSRNCHHENKIENIIRRRFQFELIIQMEAYTSIFSKRFDVFNMLTTPNNKYTFENYIEYALSVLLDSFNQEVTGISIVEVKKGKLCYLHCNGNVPFGYQANGQPNHGELHFNEVEENWYEEKSFVKNSYDEIHHLPCFIKEELIKNEIQSFGFFLIRNLQFSPTAYLFVCSKFAGYFSLRSRRHYWGQIANLIGHLSDLFSNTQIARQTHGSKGLHFRKLLRQEKVEMHYQPIIDLNTGRTVKVEALARLVDGDRIVNPGLFLPSFGANHLKDLFEIGINKIQNDFPLIKKIQQDIVCSINLPPEAISDKQWLKHLPYYLENSKISPESINLEILESILHDDNTVISSLFSLQEAGYKILLDDVGAGESSLLRLVKLPACGIKIDRGFVQSAQNFDSLDLILSLRIIALQRGLEFVIEGVENFNMLDMFSSLGGIKPMVQGYYFSKPLNILDLVSWLQANSIVNNFKSIPESLYGWYARHIERLITISNSLHTSADLISVEAIQNAQRCPLHQHIYEIGGNKLLEDAHIEWHHNYARWAQMIQSGINIGTLSSDIEKSKKKLRTIIKNIINDSNNMHENVSNY